jgi:hypothetical protein
VFNETPLFFLDAQKAGGGHYREVAGMSAVEPSAHTKKQIGAPTGVRHFVNTRQKKGSRFFNVTPCFHYGG